MLKRDAWKKLIFLMIFLLIYSTFQTVSIGLAEIPPRDVIMIILRHIPLMGRVLEGVDYPGTWETIIMDVRLPRVLAGIFVGASLAVSGATMQGIFRNPMADPFIIGISSGAALGAAISLLLERVLNLAVAAYISPILAFLGAVGTVFLVYGISRVGGRIPVETLLLAGIAVASFLSAVTSALIYTLAKDVYSVLFWLTGSLGASQWSDISILSGAFIVGVVSIFLLSRDLNAMLLGEEVAQSLGTEVEEVKRIALIVTSLVTAATVASSGIIGFVGLIIPHIARLITGPDHRILIPSSALMGGIFLLWCDVFSRTVLPVPVGIVTALFGSPFFIYLLREGKRKL